MKLVSAVEHPWKAMQGGGLVGAGLVVLLALVTVVRLLLGASWEVLEWAGIIGMVLGFPLTLAADRITGLDLLFVVAVAIVVDWAIAGFLLGCVIRFSRSWGNTK